MQVKKQQSELDMKQQTGSKSGKEYIKGAYCHPAYLSYMQRTSGTQKSNPTPRKEVGKNIKDNKIDKRRRDGVPSGKGVLKREKFPNTRKPSHCRICAELWKHRGQHNREEK